MTRHLNVASTYCDMGVVYEQLGNFQKALEIYEMDLEITQKCLGDNHASVADTKYNIARLYRDQGDNVQAKTLFREAAEVYTKVYGADHSDTVDAFNQAM